MRHVVSNPRIALSVIAAAALVACGGGVTDEGLEQAQARKGFNVATVAGCRGSNDVPETALQGQVPAALRQAGFKGFNCNLELVGQYRGEGGNWSSATFSDGTGRHCAYHSTGTPTASRTTPGVPVLDITDPTQPVRTTSLTTKAMLDPWESLRVNAKRQILIADNGSNSSAGDSTIDIYDLSADCRSPQLMASLQVGTGTDGGLVQDVKGHEGNVAPDGLTYWVGDLVNRRYHAVDITNTSKPKLISTWSIDELGVGSTVHGLSLSADGNRAYAVALGFTAAGAVLDPNAVLNNGFVVLDTTEVQQRKPNPQIKLISKALFKDGSVAQHTIPIKIDGKPYVVMVDEGGSGGIGFTGSDQMQRALDACAAGLAPFPMARLFDISDEKNPRQVTTFALETHDPKNCSKVLPDTTGLGIFTYGSHYCSVDNRENATALACSYFNSGIRVFDIRKPEKVREVAYYNPPSATALPGSNHVMFGQWRAGGPDWCASRLDFDIAKKQLVTMCQDNGLVVLKFGPGTWPFPQSTPSRDQS